MRLLKFSGLNVRVSNSFSRREALEEELRVKDRLSIWDLDDTGFVNTQLILLL